MTNVICIAQYSDWHGHSLTFISTETGERVEEIGVPQGYGWSGVEIVKTERRFIAAKDTFKQGMAELGFDMKGWCAYRRRKTFYVDFLKAVTQGFHGYNVINVIEL